MRTLFIYPLFPKTFWSYEKILELVNRKVLLPPLGLVTVAALLPQEEVLQISERTSELVIGIPKEESFQEKRVALVPEAVALLVARGHPPLMAEEQLAARLYTGPIYEKLNAVLRALSGNAFLKRRCDELTLGNTYATTIHAVSSCVLKLSKLAVATKVYRGLQSAALPDRFFEPDGHNVCGGIEFGFTSTSQAKAEALAYATSVAEGKGSASCPTLLELDSTDYGCGFGLRCTSLDNAPESTKPNFWVPMGRWRFPARSVR